MSRHSFESQSSGRAMCDHFYQLYTITYFLFVAAHIQKPQAKRQGIKVNCTGSREFRQQKRSFMAITFTDFDRTELVPQKITTAPLFMQYFTCRSFGNKWYFNKFYGCYFGAEKRANPAKCREKNSCIDARASIMNNDISFHLSK